MLFNLHGHYHGVHTINNAAMILMGLLYGQGIYEKSIAISVMGGWDTDCTGAAAKTKKSPANPKMMSFSGLD